MPAKNDTPIYQLKVTLLQSHIPIWRRFLVRQDVSLGDLHHVLQAVMGWEESHLHMFATKTAQYGPADFELDCEDEDRTSLDQVFTRVRQKMVYEYDFGDGWTHEILFEKRLPEEGGIKVPVCLEGENTCPPEDCGGVWGYADLLETLADPEAPDHEDMLEWVGGEFDPAAFDIEEVNARLHGGSHHARPRFGQLPPSHSFILNSYQDVRFSTCPDCDKITRLRKFVLLIHVDDLGFTALNKSTRFCPDCDILIVHEDELETELKEHLEKINPDAVGNEYMVVGTVDRKIWQRGLKEELSIDEVLANSSDFAAELEMTYEPAGWYQE